MLHDRTVPRLATFLAALLVSAGLLAGCTKPTPYQPIGAHGDDPRYGYAEQELSGDRYRVTASGNEATSRETVENYLLFRAAELTRNRGREGFRIIERDVEPTTRYMTTYTGYYRPYGYPFVPGPFYYSNFGYLGPRDVYSRPFTRYKASAEIQLLEELPDEQEPDVYVAQELLTQLAPSIHQPQGQTY